MNAGADDCQIFNIDASYANTGRFKIPNNKSFRQLRVDRTGRRTPETRTNGYLNSSEKLSGQGGPKK